MVFERAAAARRVVGGYMIVGQGCVVVSACSKDAGASKSGEEGDDVVKRRSRNREEQRTYANGRHA
jgi:hypothetical protein